MKVFMSHFVSQRIESKGFIMNIISFVSFSPVLMTILKNFYNEDKQVMEWDKDENLCQTKIPSFLKIMDLFNNYR